MSWISYKGRAAGHGVVCTAFGTRLVLPCRVELPFTSQIPESQSSFKPCTTNLEMPAEADPKQDKAASAAQARQLIDLFHEISTLLVRSPNVKAGCLLLSRGLTGVVNRMQTSIDTLYQFAYH
jgi:hypothetical protein